jgi:hypothetical protein
MALYLLALMLPLYFTIRILKLVPKFKSNENWTLFYEIGFALILFLILGVWNFFVGFIMENPEGRWNIYTFLDSVKSTLILGTIPYFLFTIQNSRFLFSGNTDFDISEKLSRKMNSDIIHINSKLKKGNISFDPEAFLYAESNGNYVVFYFFKDNNVEKEMVRNSIGDIEKQLSTTPFLMRTHRAFIVNLKNVIQKKGNSSGYRLKLVGTDTELPVSRQNTANYDKIEQELLNCNITTCTN